MAETVVQLLKGKMFKVATNIDSSNWEIGKYYVKKMSSPLSGYGYHYYTISSDRSYQNNTVYYEKNLPTNPVAGALYVAYDKDTKKGTIYYAGQEANETSVTIYELIPSDYASLYNAAFEDQLAILNDQRNSTYSEDDDAALVVKGGASIYATLAAQSLKLDNAAAQSSITTGSTQLKGVEMIYDNTDDCLKFNFYNIAA